MGKRKSTLFEMAVQEGRVAEGDDREPTEDNRKVAGEEKKNTHLHTITST